MLEDDARFESNFKAILSHVMNEVKAKEIEWDLIYLGRKIMDRRSERWNEEVDLRDGFGLRVPAFSHWTVAYALSLRGAQKLLDAKPLVNLIPVDEWLPLMYGHPSK